MILNNKTRTTFDGTCICLMHEFLSPLLKFCTCNFSDPELKLFKVIQGQIAWCQSEFSPLMVSI